jgi:uncharacterized membrane protein YedE/YeeE
MHSKPTSPTAVVDPETLTACADAEGSRPATAAWFVAAGMVLGVLFIKSEVLSWYRIQEMFRFQSVHMYGVIAGALAVATTSMQAIRRLKIRAWNGEEIAIPQKQTTPLGVRYWAGGTIFGLGWGLLGACPGPMFALFGAGVTAIAVAIVSAMAGTWAYAALQSRLPH